MKKLIVLLLTFGLVTTSCENEPLDPILTGDDGSNNGGGNNDGGGNNGGGNNNNDILALASYSFDTNTNVPFFGEFIVNIDYTFNSDNLIGGIITNSPVFGQDIVTNTEITRNSNNKITETNTFYLGQLSDVTTITYNGSGQITQITYNDIESNDEDYEYNFSYSGNVVTKTEVGSEIITEYTYNNSDRLIKKESFINGNSIQLEVLEYDNNGNVISSIMTGDINTMSTYNYDSFENPLVEPFQARDYLSSLGDEYDDQAGNDIAQFGGANNWIGITTDNETFNFNVTYDNSNRILSRNGNFGDSDVTITQEEVFNYVN